MKSNRSVPAALSLTLFILGSWITPAAVSAAPLDPLSLEKYVDPLPIPSVMPQAPPNYYEVGMWQIQHKLHRDLPPTTMWAYGPSPELASVPGPTIEAVRNTPIQVHWVNHLPMEHLLAYAIDPTLHMAHAHMGCPTVVHLHGGATEPQSDGHPEAWFTPGFAEKGPTWKKEVYTYANRQPPTTLWYHDHALGYTRLNMHCGLFGFYLLRDPGHEPPGLPSGRYEIPLVIQDQLLNDDGSLFYPNVGDNPEHPVWVPEFFGDLITVNGKIWPRLDVEPRKYRFRILNASNARVYALALNDRASGMPGPAFQVIGSDGGYLPAPVRLAGPGNQGPPELTIATAERADVVIDFSRLAPGTELIMKNHGRAPFPSGDPVDPQTTGDVMMFRVVPSTGPDPSTVPDVLAQVERLANPSNTRRLWLQEVEGENGPLMALLSGLTWMDPVTETPVVGSTEVWEIYNTTEDAHPIHIHLIQFQVLDSQPFDVDRFMASVEGTGGASHVGFGRQGRGKKWRDDYLRGSPKPPEEEDAGWKDTFRMMPGEVTRVIVRFAPQDGMPAFAFDATAEPGYVWHCHISEHEDNDMMRPYMLVPAAAATTRAGADGQVALSASNASIALRVENPAAPGVGVTYALPRAAQGELSIYDVRGLLVRTLSRGAFAAGAGSTAWDGRDQSGAEAPSGVYFLRLNAGGMSQTRKLVFRR